MSSLSCTFRSACLIWDSRRLNLGLTEPESDQTLFLFFSLALDDLLELKLLKSFFGEPQKQDLGGGGEIDRREGEGGDAMNVLEDEDVLRASPELEFESHCDRAEEERLFPFGDNWASANPEETASGCSTLLSTGLDFETDALSFSYLVSSS
eukprot:Gb_26890 [translate_table: standard]